MKLFEKLGLATIFSPQTSAPEANAQKQELPVSAEEIEAVKAAFGEFANQINEGNEKKGKMSPSIEANSSEGDQPSVTITVQAIKTVICYKLSLNDAGTVDIDYADNAAGSDYSSRQNGFPLDMAIAKIRSEIVQMEPYDGRNYFGEEQYKQDLECIQQYEDAKVTAEHYGDVSLG